jgi:hypothetical protein
VSERNPDGTHFIGRAVMVASALGSIGLYFFAPREAAYGVTFVFLIFLLIVDHLQGSA